MVDLICSFQDDDFLYLVMEYLPGGDMMRWLIDRDIFTEEEAKFYIAELILSVDSIHQLEYVHRDLKPDNILLSGDGHIKLSDFGLSKTFIVEESETDSKALLMEATDNQSIKKNNQSNRRDKVSNWKKKARLTMYSTVGSSGYIAPEVLLKKGYGVECDWWSVGIIMFEMLFGYPPLNGEDAEQTCHKIIRWKEFLEFPEDIKVSEAAIDLMRKLLCDPQDRIKDINEMKQHPFFKGIEWEQIRQQQAPFLPDLKSDEDHSYFDAFPDDKSFESTVTSDGKKHRNLVANENHVFYGYTFNRKEKKETKGPSNSKKLDDLFK
jgi:serine/threonine kinase 38